MCHFIINDCVIAGLLPNLLSYCQMLLLSMSAFPSPTDTIKDLRNYCLKNYHLRKSFTRKWRLPIGQWIILKSGHHISNTIYKRFCSCLIILSLAVFSDACHWVWSCMSFTVFFLFNQILLLTILVINGNVIVMNDCIITIDCKIVLAIKYGNAWLL